MAIDLWILLMARVCRIRKYQNLTGECQINAINIQEKAIRLPLLLRYRILHCRQYHKKYFFLIVSFAARSK